MAQAMTNGRATCSICGKERIAYKCGGCSQDFCFSHLGEHRQTLSQQFDEIETDRDQFHQALVQQKETPKRFPLMEQIDKWEEISIKKIKQTAEECRQKLIEYKNKHLFEIENKLSQLTEQLKQSHQENDFNEIDLDRFKTKLAKLAKELNQPPNSMIQQDSTSFINKLSIVVSSGKRMHQSSDSIDASSRLKQFAWEQWDNQVIAVIFRPGCNGLDRYVLKRYVEQVLFQSERWKHLSSYFSSISPVVRAYSLTSNEIELMRRILDYHLNDQFRLRITQANDQLIEYEDLLDFISRVQELYNKNSNSYHHSHSINGKIPSIPIIHSLYILPSLTTKSMITPVVIQSKTQSNKIQESTTTTTITNNNYAKIDSNGWIQINNVYLPFIVKNHQRYVPYQVLVSCKILEVDELRTTLIHATTTDITLINTMIRECKINNEQIPANALLINVYHVLIGTKNLIYIKILPKDNPTLKINRQYKNVLSLHGGSLYIKNYLIPFVCSSHHSYIPLNTILNIYPNLQIKLKNFARVPHTYELDYLQLVQMYYNEENLLSLDTLLIDMKDLYQTDIVLSNTMTLIEYHAKEKTKFEQKLILINNLSLKKRKNPESSENKQIKQKLKTSHQPTSTFVRPLTGNYPIQSIKSTSSNQQNNWISTNDQHPERTHWQ
ncbi:unnamed protein product [Rotaria sp. Silwood1]|nr:unnamed protein product [Rotaria sp. Silwood1]